MLLYLIFPGKLLKRIHKINGCVNKKIHEHQLTTESPKSIQEVAVPIGDTSAMPFIATLPGKLTNISQVPIKIILNVAQYQPMLLNDKQKLAGS